MTSSPIAWDLFCCAGGASMGLSRAGFQVVGFDISHQPNYPFQFIQADAFAVSDMFDLKWLESNNAGIPDFIWASPPCQGLTAYKRRPNHVKPVQTIQHIERIRRQLMKLGVPFVIENVPGAPLVDPVLLCGSMFDETIHVRRHRLFEAHGFQIPALACRHERANGDFAQATNRKNRRKTVEIGVWRIPLKTQQIAMGGVGWMTREELSESIPPAYAEHIGRAALAQIRRS